MSVSTAAVTLAASKLGTLDDRRVLVLGAGEMGESVALALAGAGVGEIVVANRTASTAEALAARVERTRDPARAALTDALDECDVLLVSTGAPDVLVERGAIEAVMERRNGRALLIVDIGVPRNVDPGAGEVFGVDLLDIDDLRAVGEQSLGAAPAGDRQGARRHRRGARPLPRSSGPRAKSRRSSPRCARAPRRSASRELERLARRLGDLDRRKRGNRSTR